MEVDCGAFFLVQMYSEAGKRKQLPSKGGTVWRRVEEVLWRTSLEDFEVSLMLEKLDETSNDKKDVKGHDTRKSRRRHNDCCDLSTVNRFRRTCWDERKCLVDDLVGPTTRYRAGSLVGFETCSPVMDPAMKELGIQGHSTRALV